MFKKAVSSKALPDCSDASTKQNMATKLLPLPAAHKVEGMHEIRIVEVNPEPSKAISAASIPVSPPEISLRVK